MKLNAIQHALLLSLLPSTSVFAAALDRSGQSIAPFYNQAIILKLVSPFLILMYRGKILHKMTQVIWQIITIRQMPH